MISVRQYNCPNCKHIIAVNSTDFMKGIAMFTCTDCGKASFAIEEALMG